MGSQTPRCSSTVVVRLYEFQDLDVVEGVFQFPAVEFVVVALIMVDHDARTASASAPPPPEIAEEMGS